MMRLGYLLVGMVFAWTAGCAPANRDQLTKEALQADPAFTTVIEKHRELQNRIETYERELSLKRSSVEQAILQLKKDLAATASGVRHKVAETKKRMQPDQQRLQLALSMADEELRATRAQRANLGRSVATLRKAAKSQGAEWTAEERARQEAQVSELLRDAERIDHEMAAIKQHARLLKIKLWLIKL